MPCEEVTVTAFSSCLIGLFELDWLVRAGAVLVGFRDVLHRFWLLDVALIMNVGTSYFSDILLCCKSLLSASVYICSVPNFFRSLLLAGRKNSTT